LQHVDYRRHSASRCDGINQGSSQPFSDIGRSSWSQHNVRM